MQHTMTLDLNLLVDLDALLQTGSVAGAAQRLHLSAPAMSRRLARLRDASNQDVADYLSVRGYFPSRSFMVDRFVLFSSRASVGGGPYIVEDAYALSA